MIHPLFGKKPKGERLEKIKASPQYVNGKFRNTNFTPQITKPLFTAIYEFIFKKSEENKPKETVVSKKIDWKNIENLNNHLIWFGHSSYFIRSFATNFLIDPVLSDSASPIPYGNRPFKGTNTIKTDDLPIIDYLILTHDHYDHMDYKTLKSLKNKVKNVIVPLGVGEHLESWGYSVNQIIERDWWNSIVLNDLFEIVFTPARHFSGRSFWSSNTLWTSYVLKTPSKTIFLGGDSGYDTHFKEIGEKYGPFDLALLENGQYNESWKYIHMMPEEVVQAAKDLKADVLFPIHSAKFALANHAWTEPLERVTTASIKENQKIITPMIGEIINLENFITQPNYWWK